eukprot:TRINITY_DN840_c0_g1_i2.p1 TRINITY_DN840_c0_g1~~TRINITY_DN840_c0_g1_i2.p1  ORF type:complete len:266 (-),score=46.49 TRINITY_DN840_c0_g1_i2:51-848(-)
MGCIADVCIWSRVLTDDEISRRWALPLDGDEDGLVGCWPMDEGAGGVVVDRCGSNDGDVTGPLWQMSVSVPPSDLSTHMLDVLRSGVGADVLLTADPGGDEEDEVGATPPEPIRCHKAILSARCPVFKAMFSNQFSENTAEKVTLREIGWRELQCMVEWCYTDNCDIDQEIALSLFAIADRFRLSRLQRQCERIILDNLDCENVCGVLECAERMGAAQLRGIAFRWILHHFGDVLQSAGFIELDKSLQWEVNKCAAKMHFKKSDD